MIAYLLKLMSWMDLLQDEPAARRIKAKKAKSREQSNRSAWPIISLSFDAAR
jgi:hypothetical protein